MQRTALITVFLSLIFFTGCQESTGNVYLVMFENAPNLFENQVYATGVRIGEIVEAKTAGNGVTLLSLTIDGEHRDLMKDSTAFYVSAGRLTCTALAGYGKPVEPGARLMGFTSSLGLGWFKTKNLMTQTSRAASERAQALFIAFEASAKGQ